MDIRFYPGEEEFTDEDNLPRGPVVKELNKLLKKDPRLYMRVMKFLQNVRKSDTLNPFEETQEIKKLDKSGLREMRIPPQAKGGVFRIYFGIFNGVIVLINAELKHKKEASKIEIAKKEFAIVSAKHKGNNL